MPHALPSTQELLYKYLLNKWLHIFLTETRKFGTMTTSELRKYAKLVFHERQTSEGPKRSNPFLCRMRHAVRWMRSVCLLEKMGEGLLPFISPPGPGIMPCADQMPNKSKWMSNEWVNKYSLKINWTVNLGHSVEKRKTVKLEKASF